MNACLEQIRTDPQCLVKLSPEEVCVLIVEREADAVLSAKIKESSQHAVPQVDPKIKVNEYAEGWLKQVSSSTKSRTVDSYAQSLRLYMLPTFGNKRVQSLHRGQIKAFLANQLVKGLSKNTCRIMHATLRVMLNAAIDDGIITSNPASRLGKSLHLATSAKQRQEEVKAMTRGQLQVFLSAVINAKNQLDRSYYILFLLLARTGMRLGEALALQWDDVYFKGRKIRVERALSDGQIGTPKSGHGRDVDMSEQLTQALQKMLTERREKWFQAGKGEIPSLVFISGTATMLDGANIRKVLSRALKTAGLPLHFTPHCLRHTFASLLLQQGESPAYVQRQLGHASIQLTVDTYGKWLPMGNKAAVDALDDESDKTEAEKAAGDDNFSESGSRTVANELFNEVKDLQVIDSKWSQRSDLNRGPTDYESVALPTELRWP
jgi:integrase